MAITHRVRAYLKEKGIQQVDVAKQIGMNPSTFRSIIYDTDIKLSYYIKICDTLKLPYDFFFK